MTLLFFIGGFRDQWVDTGATLDELPEEIEYIKSIDKPSIKPIILPTVVSKKTSFQSDEDVLLLLLTELDKFDD